MKEEKFENIYTEESDSIFRFCLTRVSNREQALDITQDTFLRFWQSVSKGEEVRNNRAFLFTIAQRLVIDWYRKKKSLSIESMSSDENNIAYEIVDERTLEEIGLGAEGRFLLSKIKELPQTDQEPIYLRFVEGLSPPDIGEILGISANAASVRLNRALEQLRKITGYSDLQQ